MRVIKTRNLIEIAYKNKPPSGLVSLQKYGEELDRRTNGLWVANELAKSVLRETDGTTFIIDSVRIPAQVKAIRRAFPSVTHIHLTASDVELRRRYEKQAAAEHDSVTYDEAKRSKTEQRVERLARIADIVIDTEKCTEDDVFVRATSLMLTPRQTTGYVDVVIGGQYGSEGKGQIISFLADEYDFIVRVGGPNAGHTVIDSNGMPHIYHNLPSGALTRSAHFVLAPGMVVNVPQLIKEIADCKLDSQHLSIDPRVMTISREDTKSEAGVYRRIGSTKSGVGVATARRITERGRKSVIMADRIQELKPFVRPTCDVLSSALTQNKRILVEGTQGTALSLYHGAYPHVTSRDTTVAGCLSEAGLPPKHLRRVVMVCRTYPIRVGNPRSNGSTGPLSKEIDWGVVSKRSGIPRAELERVEVGSTTGRLRRVGEFDWSLLRKAVFLNSPTDIALTHTDYVTKKNGEASKFEQLSRKTIEFIEEIERVAGAPVSLVCTGRGDSHVIDRRLW
jgi:adenylosuccinate synthase